MPGRRLVHLFLVRVICFLASQILCLRVHFPSINSSDWLTTDRERETPGQFYELTSQPTELKEVSDQQERKEKASQYWKEDADIHHGRFSYKLL